MLWLIPHFGRAGHISLSNCLSINTSFINIGTLVPEIWGFKGWHLRPFLPTLSKFGGPYHPHHWSDWPKILDLVLWVPKQHVYKVSLKSETVGFKFFFGWFDTEWPISIMHPFHAICTHFIIAITSLPPSHPSLLPSFFPPSLRPSVRPSLPPFLRPSVSPSLLLLPGFTLDICSVIAQNIKILFKTLCLVTFKFLPLKLPLPPHQLGRVGGGVKNVSIFSAVHEISRNFFFLTLKTPNRGVRG